MRWVVITAVAGLLCACGPSKAERAAKFAARCDKAGFTVPQCAMLFEIVERAAADAGDAAALGAAGLAVGAAKR